MWRRDRNPQNEKEAAPGKRDLSKISVSSIPGGNPINVPQVNDDECTHNPA